MFRTLEGYALKGGLFGHIKNVFIYNENVPPFRGGGGQKSKENGNYFQTY
jgi:hypothetical protein